MPVEPFSIELPRTGPDAGIVTLRLEQPGKPVVVLDESLLQRLEATLRALPADATGLVLASASERVFVAGADLKSISDWPDDRLGAYLAFASRVYAMIADLPYPTAAAINGAALGGGLELAMHCDGLIGAPSPSGKPYPLGLPEASLGLCPGWGGTNLLPARIDPAEAIRRTAEGTTLPYDEAVAARLFDDTVTDPRDLLPAARAWVRGRRAPGRLGRDGAPSRWIGRPAWAAAALRGLDSVRGELPRTAQADAVAEAVDAGLLHGWKHAVATEQRHLVRLRHTPEARERLAAFFSRSAKS